jgi:hypothetical protein
MTMQGTCPGPADLKNLLEGTLPAEVESRLSGHLEQCSRCQQALECLAGGVTEVRQLGRQGLYAAPNPEALRKAILALKAGSPTQEARGDADWGEELLLGALAPSANPTHLGRLGPYEVTEVIGRGAFGVVFKAFDPVLHRFVALKVLSPHMASSVPARKRFAREGRAAAAVSHEHIVAIHGVDEANGLPYLVMEYVCGVSLQQRLDRTGPLELKEILRIGMQTAAGLAAAHAQGLIHRDIKPANILLEHNVERVKITDFGLARAVDDASLTQSGMLAGTPQYMAPEQARGEPLDHRADLFSLGSVLYALCTGRPPFRGSTTLAVLRRICDDVPRAVKDINPDVSDWLAEVIAILHAKDRADRFQSAAEVADLLGQHLVHLQQPALRPKPPPLPPRGRQAARLRRRRLLMAGLGLLCGFGLLMAARAADIAGYFGTGARRPPVTAALPRVQPGIVAPPQAPAAPMLGRQGAPFLSAAFSPDGALLAVACDDKTVQLWQPHSQQLRRVLVGHTDRVWSVAFSPNGRLLASAAGEWEHQDEPGEVRIWDVTTGALLHSLTGHTGPVFSVAFSGDGKTVASASADRTVRIWDAETGKLHAIFEGHANLVRAVAFDPLGQLLATGAFDGTVRLLDAATGQQQAVLNTTLPHVNWLAFSPDGKTLAVAANDRRVSQAAEFCKLNALGAAQRPGHVELWNIATLQRVAVLEGARGHVLCVAFAPDGKTVATGGGDWTNFGEVLLWDIAGGHIRNALHKHTEWVECVAFSPDGRTLVSAGGTRPQLGQMIVDPQLFLAPVAFGPRPPPMPDANGPALPPGR